MGGKVHLKLNTDGRPIANKYREGKMKRTLKRVIKQGLKLLRGKALETNRAWTIQHQRKLSAEVHACQYQLALW